jgi:hypothetical protein
MLLGTTQEATWIFLVKISTAESAFILIVEAAPSKTAATSWDRQSSFIGLIEYPAGEYE